MLEFSLNSRKNTRDALQKEKDSYESRLLTLRRLAQTLRSDLFTTTDTEASEAIILKKIEISKQIEQLSDLQDAFYSFLDSHELIHIIDELDTDKYHKLEIADKAFKRFEKMGSREVSD